MNKPRAIAGGSWYPFAGEMKDEPVWIMIQGPYGSYEKYEDTKKRFDAILKENSIVLTKDPDFDDDDWLYDLPLLSVNQFAHFKDVMINNGWEHKFIAFGP